jgi:hypothetical protein
MPVRRRVERGLIEDSTLRRRSISVRSSAIVTRARCVFEQLARDRVSLAADFRFAGDRSDKAVARI